MNKEEIKKFIEKEGYTYFEYEGIWNNFEVYYVYFGEKNKVYHTGLPFYALVSGEKIRLTRPDECLKVLKYFNLKNEEEN